MSEFSRYRDPSVPLTALAAAQADTFSPVHDLWATHKRIQLLEDEASDAALSVDALQQRVVSSLASATLNLTTQPTAGDRITIGADTYQFLALTTDAVSNDAYIGVARGGSASAARTNLVAAINGARTTSFGEKANGSPAARNGTEEVFAFIDGVHLVVVPADEVGGAPLWNSLPNIALADNLTAAVNWSVANLNLGAANVLRPTQVCRFDLTITADMVSAGSTGVYVPVDDASAVLRFLVRSATGDIADPQLGADTATYTALGNGTGKVVVTIGGADLVATNVISFELLVP